MQLFLTDETNMVPSADARFFIYGGLIVPMEQLMELDRGIRQIREEAGYSPTDLLKFDTNTRPSHVSHDVATEAKKRVVQGCQELGCKFIVHLIHHEIIHNQDARTQVTWAINYVIGGFNYYLRHIQDDGICLIDTLPVQGQWQFLKDKFSRGLQLEGGQSVHLERIKLFGATCINASHGMSATDIILGSFRYCMNNPANLDAASEMMLNVVKMTWHRYDPETDTYHVNPRGFIVRPDMSDVRWAGYRDDYDDLITHLQELLRRADQSRQP